MDGRKKSGYDDSHWQQGMLPIVHGGLRHAGEELCLRRTAQIDEVPPLAEPYVESLIPSFIDSPERAYFNFEHDEIICQPNWKVHQGKPSYQVASYEHFYDEVPSVVSQALTNG